MDDITEAVAADIRGNAPAPLSAFPELGPFIYYIQCGSFLKIGTSINPESRCDQLKRGGKAIRPSIWVGSPSLIAYIPGNVAKERELHRQFATKRDQSEWFLLDHELAEHVSDVQVQQCLAEVHVHQKRYEQYTGSSADLDLARAYQMSAAGKQRIDTEWIDAFAESA
ncbi:MAG TPA: hypothetical protein DEV93_00185 [Chloroflexi bacterium]|jgi:hypothetical protein|nr:hypothetical protein [Chloroflexota bacterium]